MVLPEIKEFVNVPALFLLAYTLMVLLAATVIRALMDTLFCPMALATASKITRVSVFETSAESVVLRSFARMNELAAEA